MKRLALFALIFLVSSVAFAQAPDRRLSDNDGDVLSVNSDGTIPVSITGDLDFDGDITVTKATPQITAQTTSGNASFIVDADGVADLIGELNFLSDRAAANTTIGRIQATNMAGVTSSIIFLRGDTDDEGRIVFYTDNDTALTLALTIDEAQKATFTGDVKAAGYESSDGSAGITGGTCSAWKNGLCTTA